MLAYRSSEHESIGTSPNSMMFGRELNLPVDLLLGRLSGNDSNSGMISDYANNLSDKLEKIHVFARKKLQLSIQFNSKLTYRPTSINRHIHPNLFDFL
jgi:hypothetical protein